MDSVPEKFNIRKKIEGCIDVLSESVRKKGIGIQIYISDDQNKSSYFAKNNAKMGYIHTSRVMKKIICSRLRLLPE
jgi:hypothetical protein